MCDVSKGGGGGLQRNEHMTFLMDKIDMRGFSYALWAMAITSTTPTRPRLGPSPSPRASIDIVIVICMIN